MAMTVIEQRDANTRIDANLSSIKRNKEEMTFSGKQTMFRKQLICAAIQGLSSNPNINIDTIPALAIDIADRTIEKVLED